MHSYRNRRSGKPEKKQKRMTWWRRHLEAPVYHDVINVDGICWGLVISLGRLDCILNEARTGLGKFQELLLRLNGINRREIYYEICDVTLMCWR